MKIDLDNPLACDWKMQDGVYETVLIKADEDSGAAIVLKGMEDIPSY